MLLQILDLAGTFVFALSGALVAVRRELDLFGVAVLACSAAFGGGVVRDVLLDAGPPNALVDPRYIAVALGAAVLVAATAPSFERLGKPVKVLDAAGLGLFAVSGTQLALEAGLPAVACVVLGVITAIGGGILRDLLAGVVPFVLRREIYALAALLGAVLTALGDRLDVMPVVTGSVAAAATVVVRILALRRGWHAPRRLRRET